MTEDITILDGKVSIKALKSLEQDIGEAIGKVTSNIEKAGLIKFFEMAYEQSWKVLKRVLLTQHAIEISGGPRDVLREAARVGYIKDIDLWFGFIQERNETVYAYDANTADEIISDLGEFHTELSRLVSELEKL